jgi:hypothetical protein
MIEVIKGIEERFIYRGNVVGLGGRITKYKGQSGLNIPIPVQGACSLPVVGGVSESNVTGCKLWSKDPEFLLAAAESVSTLAEGGVSETGDYVTHVRADVKGVQFVDTVSAERVLMDLTSTHVPGETCPHISPGDSAIVGLKLGDCAVDVSLDLKTLQTYNTKASLAEAYENNPDFRAKNWRRFNTPEGSTRMRELTGGYYLCSIVEKISGDLPKDAYIGENGYTIVWPAVGRIVLGEILITAFARRLTMLRVHFGCPTRGDGGAGEGETNGSTVP